MPVKYKSAKRKMSKPAKKKVNMAHGKKTKMYGKPKGPGMYGSHKKKKKK